MAAQAAAAKDEAAAAMTRLSSEDHMGTTEATRDSKGRNNPY
jgi:hypothetical protein